MAAHSQAVHAASDKWANWKSAVSTGCKHVKSEHNCREHRLDIAGRHVDAARLVSTGPMLRNVAVQENDGVRACFERYGRWHAEKFHSLKVLGEGAFGIVHLVRHKDTPQLFALKQMEKSRFQRKNRQRAFAERDTLSKARSRWSVELYATFQDARHVYMVTEFLQGGDLVALLQRKARFTPAETGFYMAELLEAISTVHKCGFVHRDIKPDNAVITASGHLKLLDFGLCKGDISTADLDDFGLDRLGTVDEGGRADRRSIVGTPQYMAPESFQGIYSPESDLWALGVIIFECLTGVVPFHSGKHEGAKGFNIVKDKILRHAEVLPERLRKARRLGFLTEASEAVITSLVCEKDIRLTADQLRTLPFFAKFDFTQLHLMTPPFVPQLQSQEDTTYFDDSRRPAVLPRSGPRLGWDRRVEWAYYESDDRVAQAWSW